MAISISVPLAASTQHILFAETAGQIFGMSTSFVDQLLRIDISEIQLVEGRESVIVGAEAVRLVRLSDVLGLSIAGPRRPTNASRRSCRLWWRPPTTSGSLW